MDDRHFPLFVSSYGKRAVIFGGGNIGERRVETLLKFSFSVTVVSPSLTEKLAERAEAGEIQYIAYCYKADYLEGSYLVIACTDDRQTNREIGEAAKARELHVSVCDRREECTFFFPAVAVNDEVTVGIVGSGKTHRVTRRAAVRLREIVERKAY